MNPDDVAILFDHPVFEMGRDIGDLALVDFFNQFVEIVRVNQRSVSAIRRFI